MSSAIQGLLEQFGSRTSISFEVELANGSTYRNRPEAPVVRIRFRNRRAQWRMALFGHVGILEAYFDGDLDIEGDLAAAFDLAFDSQFDRSAHDRLPLRWRNKWHEGRFSNRSIAQARINARFHYGLGADFFRLWLDNPLMMYTCAYWPEGTSSVEQAQRNKIEHVCRKIRLQPGESVIDIGTGFGGFMRYAVEHYGVHGVALNTTDEQVTWLRDEVARLGLGASIDVRHADFREVDRQFDKVVSIGVLEHAGRDQIAEVVKAHADFLKPGGLGMLHFIGHVGMRDTEFYIRKYVFPGGWIPSLSETLSAMEANGLEIVDVENLRRHYALTLGAWAERFDANWERIHALDPKRFDDRFRRIWRTYLYSCAAMFRARNSQTYLFQIVFSKGNLARHAYPMSRSFLYREPADPQPQAPPPAVLPQA